MNNNNWLKSVAKTYSQLDEARKMKPTATDRKKNIEIERAARLAHQKAATAITSVPGFKIHGKYSGMNSAEDPEHDNVTAHLAAIAPSVTDPKTAIELGQNILETCPSFAKSKIVNNPSIFNFQAKAGFFSAVAESNAASK